MKIKSNKIELIIFFVSIFSQSWSQTTERLNNKMNYSINFESSFYFICTPKLQEIIRDDTLNVFMQNTNEILIYLNNAIKYDSNNELKILPFQYTAYYEMLNLNKSKFEKLKNKLELQGNSTLDKNDWILIAKLFLFYNIIDKPLVVL